MLKKFISITINAAMSVVSMLTVYYMCDATSSDRVTIAMGGMILFALGDLGDKIFEKGDE